MTKALLKKQFSELLSTVTMSGKRGKRRSKGALALYILLFLYVGAAVVLQFALVFGSLCGPLCQAGLGWLYFGIAGLTAASLSVVLGMFLAKSQLFEAKDNELLLSMPIPFRKILLSRLVPLYVQNLLVTVLVLATAFCVYGVEMGLRPGQFGTLPLLLLSTPLLGLSLTCLLGWLAAFLASRVRWKNAVTVVIFLLFMGAYLVLVLGMNRWLGLLLANASEAGASLRAAVPLYLFGKGMTGDLPAALLFTMGAAALMVFVWLALSAAFRRIAGSSGTVRGAAGKKEKRWEPRQASPGAALLRKDWGRFLKTPIYLLNAGLGTFFLLILAGAFLLRGRELWALFLSLPLSSETPPAETACLAACAALCLMASTNTVSAPSVSLESGSLDLLRSLPVSGWQVLKAKLWLHLWVTAPAALLCGLAVDLAAAPELGTAFFLPLLPVLFVLLSGELGLLFNLKFSNLNWTSEMAAVKQGPAVALALFLCWGLTAALGGFWYVGGWLFRALPGGFLLPCCLLLIVLCAALGHALKNWGAKRLREL